jgi:hypothetical protein
MQYFARDGSFHHLMEDRQKRNKIYAYFSDANKAADFLRVEDCYKADFISDFVLQ